TPTAAATLYIASDSTAQTYTAGTLRNPSPLSRSVSAIGHGPGRDRAVKGLSLLLPRALVACPVRGRP
ncbi:hypothetical protein AB0I97_27085, partial [Streptomyces sp. NPDC049951]|uniref:hypothetical protein n=1 Tax=Streptomyces sp. NPDC049951 TaxID=3156660 RepID=UPI0034415957